MITAAFGGISIGPMRVEPFALRFETESTVRRDLRQDRIWERHLTVYLAAAFRHGRTFFDVGANVGYYSVLAAKIAPGARVVAFEPQPAVADCLRENLGLNGCPNVEVVQAAVTASSGTVAVVPDDGQSEAAYVSARKGEFQAVSLDDFCGSSGLRPGIIKTDIQGLDFEALWGGRQVIAEAMPLIVSEFAPGLLARASIGLGDVFDLLGSLGYEPAIFRGHIHCAVELISFPILAEISELWIRDRPNSHMDVVFRPPAGKAA